MAIKTDIIIVGAGPVGLLLGNLLAAAGISVLILEKHLHRKPGSKAIGITPVSLSILTQIGMAETVIRQGLKLHEVQLFVDQHRLGRVRLDCLPPPFAYILALPQEQTEHLLEENLKKYPAAVLARGREVYKLAEEGGQKRVTARIYTEPGAGPGGEEETYAGRIICGCDGHRSTVRQLLHIPFRGRHYPETFLMGDYRTEHDDNKALLFFTSLGSVESFPLPGDRRRWIIQTPSFIRHDLPAYLERQVEARTGIRLQPAAGLSAGAFQPQRYLAASFFRDTIVLCGDAAHTMSPIGGQGMNTGFGDADWLASLLCSHLQGQAASPLVKLLADYEYVRKKAIRVTADRASLSMRLGTLKGRLAAGARNCLLYMILHSPVSRRLPLLYSGHSIPFNKAVKPGSGPSR